MTKGTRLAPSGLVVGRIEADFARLVVLAGHGAKVVNNPHASALQCSACGGQAKERREKDLILAAV
ncbi:MAG: putative inorganic carbon transporter subunit DabA [Acetobacteraceae bacterium]